MKRTELWILVVVLIFFNCQTIKKNIVNPFELHVLTQGQPWDRAVKVDVINTHVYCEITREVYKGSDVLLIKENEADYYISDTQLNDLLVFLDALNIFELKDDYSNEDDTSEFDTYIFVIKDNKQKKIHVGPSESVSEINKLMRYLNENVCANGIKLQIR